MDLKEIKKLLDLIAESEVNEVAIEEGDFKIKVKKKGDTQQVNLPQQIPAQQFQAPAQVSQPQPSGGAPSGESAQAEAKEEKVDGDVVKSPIVGTFYRSPSPDSEAFVQTGDSVEKGQTLCIVEAMKIMNEIESEYSGEVKKILVEDGEPVEYDQPLFVIG
ncbi:acetyl-CoA carboxylase biotin carboxyl carrier protein [Aliifodinibius sp. S!AR15-10]|uniref:acetyl-CoA carboxylase biotin carboxyl carrier protein n=1 Tax=Aliifodinibius sp. S!AR15-10 TaxID=2950437 RepID=UPI002860BE26|nr:acetyl-CoA carboxylase biotin carboxyl carrier protein [Aliifodinibius sp. S!AR15-10]MDR8391031.1 acetyl-CoA carboxylase biotin carboxyl carrier protein [Aliifodinibius sp. S!AR15-10]